MDSEEILTLIVIGGIIFYMYKKQSSNGPSIPEQVGEKIADVVNDVKDKVNDVANEVKDTVNEVVDDVKSAFDRGIGRIPDQSCPQGKVMYAGPELVRFCTWIYCKTMSSWMER